jgi:putative DNA primase/helicase
MEMKNAAVSITNVDDTKELNTQPTVAKKYKPTIAIPNLKPPEKEEQKTKDLDNQLSIRDQVSCLDNAQPLDRETFPHQPRSGSSQLPATIPNIEHLLERYGVKVRYNVIKKKLEILLPGHTGTIDNADNVAISYIISLASLNGMPIGQVPAYVEVLADRNVYNPIAEWITNKPWDGKDRLPKIYATITEREDYPERLKEILIRKWLLSAVAAVLKPSGFKARGVLTLQGPQGVGKTSWIRSLVPDEQLCELTVKLDHHLDGSNKDSIIGAVTHWLVEIGELDSSFKKDISRLKGFLTSDCDKIRRPYARTYSDYQRRTVFFASVNKIDFLIDDTGNTRFWTIPVTAINYQHDIDMQQLFAQLAEDFGNGKQWWLTQQEEELLESCNIEHKRVSVIRERLLEIVDMDLKGKDGNPAMSATEVLAKLDYLKPTNPLCRECGGILRELFGDPKKIRGIKKWRIPLTPSMKIDTVINNSSAYDFGDELDGF